MNQSGRSMIEMLGVLAIVGVLSVGALKGYSYAMEKHRLNKIINAINQTLVAIDDLKGGSNDAIDLETLFKAGVFEGGILASDGTIIMPSGFVMDVGDSGDIRIIAVLVSGGSFFCQQLLTVDWVSKINASAVTALKSGGYILAYNSAFAPAGEKIIPMSPSDVASFCADLPDITGIGGILPEYGLSGAGFAISLYFGYLPPSFP